MKLTAHFTLAELTHTSTGLPNYPGDEQIEALRALAVHVLEPVRVAIGWPVSVSSGYRSAEVNTKVHGAKNSQHMRGEAADISVAGMTPADLARRIVALGVPLDQLVVEPSWVHVSYRTAGNRGQLLRKTATGYAPWAP